MTRMIFVNLPVTDLNRSMRFCETLGSQPGSGEI
jgi:predicted lactoylglutathione lyase|tara:strand:+ start:7116 stop:7217 length:102 start_codon:yes stop_codon:yes gene_type:complete